MKIGYARVSIGEQNPALQLAARRTHDLTWRLSTVQKRLR
jgi:hypothetical protein